MLNEVAMWVIGIVVDTDTSKAVTEDILGSGDELSANRNTERKHSLRHRAIRSHR